MNFDSNLPGNQGNTKLSEIAIDRTPKLFDTAGPQTNALTAEEVQFAALTELARRQNYILRSVGNMNWSGTQLRFDDSAVANNIVFDVLATEGATNHSFSLVMQGSTTVNGTNTFEFINLTDGDMLYMELNSALITDLGASFNLDNAASGTGTTVGMRLLKTTVAAGMPKVTQSPTGGTLFNIPLAIVRLNAGLGTNDIFWIPHGIRWPAGTVSNLGAVLVNGPQPWPDHFASSEATLNSAITACSAAGGGVILVTAPFSITGSINIPANTKLIGRGPGINKITMVNGSFVALNGQFASMEHVTLVAQAGFAGLMVVCGNANGCTMRECNIDMTNMTDVNTNIGVSMNFTNCRMYRNYIKMGSPLVNKIGISYQVGATGPNTDMDTLFY